MASFIYASALKVMARLGQFAYALLARILLGRDSGLLYDDSSSGLFSRYSAGAQQSVLV